MKNSEFMYTEIIDGDYVKSAHYNGVDYSAISKSNKEASELLMGGVAAVELEELEREYKG